VIAKAAIALAKAVAIQAEKYGFMNIKGI